MDPYDCEMFFGGGQHQQWFVAIKWHWVQGGVLRVFEDQSFCNDPDNTINILYKCLFAHYINFIYDPDCEGSLLYCIFLLFYHRRLSASFLLATSV
jgi:hypothetical protein